MPKGNVQLSNVPTEVATKNEVAAAVGESSLSLFHKKKIWEQNKAGKLDGVYGPVVKSILQAKSQGSTYRPGQDGL